MTATLANPPWLVNFTQRPHATSRLICFSHAGGGAVGYRAWAAHLPPTVDLCAVRLPGRETRLREAAYTDWMVMVSELVDTLPLDKPFAFFGHSMGALVAFEMARLLQKRGLPSPTHLFLSGRQAPQMPSKFGSLHHLPDEQFMHAVGKKYGGIPDAVLQHEELVELIRPILRADLTLVETYQHRDEPPLDCPIIALGGLEDAPDRADLAAWRVHTSVEFNLHLFPGGHFYLEQQRNALLRTLLTYISEPNL